MRFLLAMLVPAVVLAGIWPENFGPLKRTSTARVTVTDAALWDEYGLQQAERAEYALGKEKLTVHGTPYGTIRYETFVFDNVLYRRKGRLLIWVTDNAQRLPVQMRFVLGFPLGDVTLELEKVEKL